jgi:hypothetical protein
VAVETPDAYFNAGVAASNATVLGLFVEPCFVHGGSRWRCKLLGWRVMGGATAYGWHDLVYRAVAFWDSRQVKKDDRRTRFEASADGCEQGSRSRLHGAGHILPVSGPDIYDMESQFFDEAIRQWRATADPAYEKRLLPMLELHLERSRQCFDPDGDGLYESYNNTWPSDSVGYNGAGTVEESAYIYYARRAAAEMRRRIGDRAAAAKHDREAEKIRAALNRVLWLKDRGQYAAFVETGGHGRVHADAWIYSQHLPIEAGLATPEQAWQAMYYTDWAMEHYRFPFGGEMRQTSNWVPGQWSLRELYPGDNFAMALGYFLGGQGDDGWEILRGTTLQSMYGDPTPRAGFSSGLANLRSPGGLSCPSSIDFNDITTMFCRAVVEGLFGYRPDYPNKIVRIEPAFPSRWDHASIRTPDFSLAFRREGGRDIYRLTFARAAKAQLRLPLSAAAVTRVSVNGRPVAWHVEPWPGCAMLRMRLPECSAAAVAIELADRRMAVPAVVLEKPVGETVRLAAAGTIRRVLDPQGCLTGLALAGTTAQGRCAACPGYHLLLAEVGGKTPYYQAVKLHITDPAGEAARAARCPREAPQNAKWKCLDLSGLFNGDVRTIFKQQYRTPRSNTCSMRIGYDGWRAYTFRYWRLETPEIGLENVLAAGRGATHEPLDRPTAKTPTLVRGEQVVTPQRVPFARIADGKNIAFTSLWDNWPRAVSVPVEGKAETVWLLACGSTPPTQGRVANAVLRFRYADGEEEKLELTPPENFWSLCRFGKCDYDARRDGFALPKPPPPQVQLGDNCRAMVYGWRLRRGVLLKDVQLETLSQEVVVGLMGVSLMNPAGSQSNPD